MGLTCRRTGGVLQNKEENSQEHQEGERAQVRRGEKGRGKGENDGKSMGITLKIKHSGQ